MTGGVSLLLSLADTTETRLQAAIHFCRENSIHILPGHHHGVLRGTGLLSGSWVVDPRRDPVTGSQREVVGVTLTGAVLLAYQPIADRYEDFSSVAARCLGVSMAWIIGADDALAEETRSSFWIRGQQRQLYTDGFGEGLRIRAALTVRCPLGHSRWYSEPDCTPCAENALVREEAPWMRST